MSGVERSPYRARIIQRGEDCPVVLLPGKPLPYVLLSDGFFSIRLESAVDAPLIAKLEIDGVQARSNFRLLPNGTHTIRETRSHMGERSTPLSFTPTELHMDPGSLSGEQDVDMFCGMLRLFFFPVRDTASGKWNLASRDPVAVLMLRYGYRRQLVHLYPTEVKEHLKSIKASHPATGRGAYQLGRTNTPLSNPTSRPISRNPSAVRLRSHHTSVCESGQQPTQLTRNDSTLAAKRCDSRHDLPREGVAPVLLAQPSFGSHRDPLGVGGAVGALSPLAQALMMPKGGEAVDESHPPATRPHSQYYSPSASPVVALQAAAPNRRFQATSSPTRGFAASREAPLLVASGPGGPGGPRRNIETDRTTYTQQHVPTPGAHREPPQSFSHFGGGLPNSSSAEVRTNPSASFLQTRRESVGSHPNKELYEARIRELEAKLHVEEDRSRRLQLQCDEWKKRFDELSGALRGFHHQYEQRPPSESGVPRRRSLPRKDVQPQPSSPSASTLKEEQQQVATVKVASGPRARTSTARPSDVSHLPANLSQRGASLIRLPSVELPPSHARPDATKASAAVHPTGDDDEDPIIAQAREIIALEAARRRTSVDTVTQHEYSPAPSDVPYCVDSRRSSAYPNQADGSSSSPVMTPSSAPHSRSVSTNPNPALSVNKEGTPLLSYTDVLAQTIPRKTSQPPLDVPPTDNCDSTVAGPNPVVGSDCGMLGGGGGTSTPSSPVSSPSSCDDSSDWMPPDIDLPDPAERTRALQGTLPRRRRAFTG